MIRKRINSTIVVVILLLSIALAAYPASAGFHRVSGYVYINGSLAPVGTDVKITFPTGDETTQTVSIGHYEISFSGHDYELGTFYVYFDGSWREPVDNKTIIMIENAYLIDLHIETINSPPNTPTPISPGDGATGVGKDSNISWSGGDPDGDAVTYDIYFGTASPPPLLTSDHPITSYDVGTMAYSTPYYWQIIAEDEHGATATSTIFSFTTGAESTGGDPPPSNGGGTSGGGGDTLPTADANGPYYEFWDKTAGYADVTFDGTGSTGSIATYTWDFGDGTTDTVVSPTHRYTWRDNFTVTLNCTGPLGFSVDETYAVISFGANNDPTDPIVSGEQTGSKEVDYEYTMISTDADNDTLKYIIDWGDGTTKTTDFYANNTEVTETHNWSAAGAYTVSVYASDNQTESGTITLLVLIDATAVGTIGYLLDTNGDGTYNSFKSTETGGTTDTDKQDDGTYYIDSDGTEGWDWVYDPVTDRLTEYVEDVPDEPAETDNTLLYVAAILIIIIILIVVYLVTKKKK